VRTTDRLSWGDGPEGGWENTLSVTSTEPLHKQKKDGGRWRAQGDERLCGMQKKNGGGVAPFSDGGGKSPENHTGLCGRPAKTSCLVGSCQVKNGQKAGTRQSPGERVGGQRSRKEGWGMQGKSPIQGGRVAKVGGGERARGEKRKATNRKEKPSVEKRGLELSRRGSVGG